MMNHSILRPLVYFSLETQVFLRALECSCVKKNQTTVFKMASSGLRQKPLSTSLEPSLKAKSTITSRLRENEGKFIRQLEQKDQEIIDLKKKLQELSDKRRANRLSRPVTPKNSRSTSRSDL